MKDRAILLVDDETDLLEMLQSIFERAGYTRILTAASGKAALKIWKEAKDVYKRQGRARSCLASSVPL